jgi:hypothetical protein
VSHDDSSRRAGTRLSLESLDCRCVPAVVGTANANFVDQLYRDILHRAPDEAGLAFWTSRLDNGSDRGFVADAIRDSEEGLGVQVNDLYLRFLDRPADAAGLAGWTNYLRDGNTNLDLASQLLASDEYYQVQGGGTNQGFLTALYEDVLCRQIGADEIADRGDDFSDGFESRRDIAEGILGSGEAEDLRDQHSVLSYLRQDVSVDEAGDIVDDDDGGSDFDNDDAVFAGTLLSGDRYFDLAQTLTATDFATIPSCDNISATGTTTTTTTIL